MFQKVHQLKRVLNNVQETWTARLERAVALNSGCEYLKENYPFFVSLLNRDRDLYGRFRDFSRNEELDQQFKLIDEQVSEILYFYKRHNALYLRRTDTIESGTASFIEQSIRELNNRIIDFLEKDELLTSLEKKLTELIQTLNTLIA